MDLLLSYCSAHSDSHPFTSTAAQENGSDVGVDLFREANELKSLLRQRLGWEYDICEMGGLGEVMGGDGDGDDEGPVLVEDPTAFVSL